MSYNQFLLKCKRKYILTLLHEFHGNQCAAASKAKLHRNTFKRMMNECGITLSIVREIRRSAPIRPDTIDHTNQVRNIYRMNRSESHV